MLADSLIDGNVDSITQQQWLSRNAAWGNWYGQNWNMVFVGVTTPPAGIWPNPPYTVITNTPLIREKPFLSLDASSRFVVIVPNLVTNSSGTTWATGPTPGAAIPISQFYLAQPGVDNAATLNAALRAGKDLMLTPGVYRLTNSLVVTRPDTMVLGLGFPTLVPVHQNPALVIADVPGVKVADIIFDAGPAASPCLLEVGTTTNARDDSADPICLYDLCGRVGGATAGMTTNCVVINANNVIGENLWLWRADHGRGVGWTKNASHGGLVVNGSDVTLYGLFVEHHEHYQTLWNGNGGRVFFYQSELPYDAPSQSAWSHEGINGYASYKVADSVTRHEAYGLGIYGVFINSTTKCLNAIETPANARQVHLHDLLTVYITGESGSEMTHVINGTGGTLRTHGATAAVSYWGKPPAMGVRAGGEPVTMNLAFGLPAGPWPACRLQAERARMDPLGAMMDRLLGGNDVPESALKSLPAARGFY